MKCPSLERLAAYQADFLSRRDREALRAHISACAACQQELALLERAAAAVAALPAPRPPDELWQRVAAQLPASPRRGWHPRWWRVAVGLGLAAGVSALLLIQQRLPLLPPAPASTVAYVAQHELLTAQDPLVDRASMGAMLMSEESQ